MHGLLILFVIVGPLVLFSDIQRKDDRPILKVIPGKVVDELMSGGGSPNAKPLTTPAVEQPKPAPPPETTPEVETPKPAPAPEPAKKIEVEPPKKLRETVKPAPKVDPAPVVPKEPPLKPTTRPKSQIKVDAKVTSRTPKELADANAKAAEEAAKAKAREEQARAAAEARRQALQRFARSLDGAADSVSENLSPGTTIEVPGPGGEAYANYGAVIKAIYDRAWIDPDNVSDDAPAVQVEVVVARDGSIVSDRVTRRSGVSALDQSVQNALKRVTEVPPFPEGAKESKRTFLIRFNLKTKRLLG